MTPSKSLPQIARVNLADQKLQITLADYAEHLQNLQHLFLVGDLRKPTPHPFFRDDRIELILCTYAAQDNGEFHWHEAVTEYELVLEGCIGYQHVSDGRMRWFNKGDLSLVPQGECVRRVVPVYSSTIAIKVPSKPGDKVHCSQCDRVCDFRVASDPSLTVEPRKSI